MTLFPVVSLTRPSSRAQQPSSGSHMLEFLDSQGLVARSVMFSADSHPAQGGAGAAGLESWLVTVEDPPEYASLRLSSGSVMFFEQNRSPAAPQIAVTSPAAGTSVSAEMVTLEWSATDADGDTLSFDVAYSVDGGATYTTVAAGLRETRLEVPRSRLAGSSRARVRIIGSDGTRSSTAESAVFSVANNAPRLRLVHPRQGRVLGGPDVLVLEATAFDREDGELNSSSITWSSSIDGVLANEGLARLGVSGLSSGTHLLTVSATDSSGASSSVTVSIVVNDVNEAPIAVDDVTYWRVGGGEARADVLANDTDTERDINPHRLRVLTAASLGAAAVRAGSARESAAVLSYAADRPGVAAGEYDVLVYEVCDRLHQCSVAELAVVVLRP